MDLLRFLGLKREGRAETDTAEVTLSGAKRLAQEAREERLKSIYPECGRICSEVLGCFSKIRKCCDLFEQSKTEIDPELRSAVKAITRKMKENFISRTRSAVALEAMPEMDYGKLAGFSEGLQGTMTKIAKINSDNRYIFSFYKEDAERFREPFGRAIILSTLLKDKIAEKHGEAEKFKEVVSLIEGLETEKERIAALESEERQAKERLEAKGLQLAGLGESVELKAKSEEFSAVSGGLNSAGGKISASVSALERALRKYGKVCDPAEKPERYSQAPISELLAEGEDYPKFKEMLARVKTLVEKGGLELKNPEKVEEQIDWLLSGNLSPLLKEYSGLVEKKRKLETELEPLQKQERERQGLESEVARLTASHQEHKKAADVLRADFERKKDELAKKFREVLGKEIAIRD